MSSRFITFNCSKVKGCSGSFKCLNKSNISKLSISSTYSKSIS